MPKDVKDEICAALLHMRVKVFPSAAWRPRAEQPSNLRGQAASSRHAPAEQLSHHY